MSLYRGRCRDIEGHGRGRAIEAMLKVGFIWRFAWSATSRWPSAGVRTSGSCT